MSASNNAKPHPDEDVLTAFAEQALPEAEREAVFSHLSGCSRCREILFVAQDAVAATMSEPKAAAVAVARRRFSWRRPVFAAFGLAMIAGTLLSWELYRHKEPLAKLTVPATTDTAKPAPPLQTVSVGSTEPPHATQPVRKVPERKANPSTLAAGPESNASQSDHAQSQAATVSVEAAPPAAVASSVAILPPAPQPGQPLIPNNGGRALVSFSAFPYPPLIKPQFRVRDGAVEGWNGSEYKTLSLPNGIKAVSVAGQAQVVLALERDGTGLLYRSVDAGGHWTRVDTQWTGKAISVQIRRGRPVTGSDEIGPKVTNMPVDPNLQNAETMQAPVSRGQSAPMPVIFELRNDAGEQWLSFDQGNTWQPE